MRQAYVASGQLTWLAWKPRAIHGGIEINGYRQLKGIGQHRNVVPVSIVKEIPYISSVGGAQGNMEAAILQVQQDLTIRSGFLSTNGQKHNIMSTCISHNMCTVSRRHKT